MDLATHAVTSLALARGFFPGRSWPFVAGVVLAGTLADGDLLTFLFGPGVYLTGRNTFTHSFVGAVVVIGIAVLFMRLLQPGGGPLQTLRLRSGQEAAATKPTFAVTLLATSLAAIVHVLMDLATASGVALLWPFRRTRFAGDCVPFLDPWMLAILVTGIVLPELLALVGSEIGAKEKAPRGRNGALFASALVVLYVGGRLILHGNAAVQLDAHSYHGESPRSVAALPDSLSLFTWHGIVETTAQICLPEVQITNAARFDPDRAVCVHKPEESMALAAAQKTRTAQEFLQAARFPRASISTVEDSYEVVLRDMSDVAQNETLHGLAARILLDRNAQVISQSIVWARSVQLR